MSGAPDDVPASIILIAAGLFGAVIGSFLNVCIYRIPRGISVVTPRSMCPHCSAQIPWYRNIPVISWFLLRGRAACCGSAISFRYPAIEAASAAAAVLSIQQWGLSVEGIARFVFLACLIALFFTDLDMRLLPDKITLTGTVAGLAFSFARPSVGPLSAFSGAAVGAGALLGIAILWKRFRKIEAMGGGDIKMMALMGAFLGLAGMLVALLFASVLGALVGCGIAAGYALGRVGPVARRGLGPGRMPKLALAAALFGRGLRRKTVPFGCFLSIGSAAAMFFGQPLIGWYASLISF